MGAIGAWTFVIAIFVVTAFVVLDLVRRAQSRSHATPTYGSDLQQMSAPSDAEALATLRAEVQTLRTRVDRLESLLDSPPR